MQKKAAAVLAGSGSGGSRNVVSEASRAGGVVRCVLGDLCKEPVDAVVNAANIYLRNGAGVAKFIKLAGGAPAAPAPKKKTAASSQGGRAGSGRAGRGSSSGSSGSGSGRQQEFIIQQECDSWILQNGPLVAGQTVAVTSAGAMPSRLVVHTVGPCWRGVNVDAGETEVIGTVSKVHPRDGGL
jgi:O-acetyl-ADP-ribose deacetylase (regulator of RNase III)